MDNDENFKLNKKIKIMKSNFNKEKAILLQKNELLQQSLNYSKNNEKSLKDKYNKILDLLDIWKSDFNWLKYTENLFGENIDNKKKFEESKKLFLQHFKNIFGKLETENLKNQMNNLENLSKNFNSNKSSFINTNDFKSLKEKSLDKSILSKKQNINLNNFISTNDENNYKSETRPKIDFETIELKNKFKKTLISTKNKYLTPTTLRKLNNKNNNNNFFINITNDNNKTNITIEGNNLNLKYNSKSKNKSKKSILRKKNYSNKENNIRNFQKLLDKKINNIEKNYIN